MNIIGRTKEIEILNSCYKSNKSEFVAIYGRRRVGKTFLIKELFKDCLTFYATGILNGSKDIQLRAFNQEISRYSNFDLPYATNWLEAFENLNKLVEHSSADKKVIFLDEIPWMATLHSDFLAGLDYFWNRWGSSRSDVLLIICGSAASWITDNIIDNHGGLHNRLTRQILVEPFNLKESEQFFDSRRIPMTRYQIAEAYMIFGGIPYYLDLMEAKFSLYQNVDRMYFTQGALLHNEFENLYHSLYRNADNYIKVVEALAQKGIGLTRNEISESSKIKDGGSLTKILRDLSISGIIREYKAYGQKKKGALYQLLDPFSLFDIRFRDRQAEFSDDYWLKFSSTSAHASWSGFAFEKLCLLHLTQIQKKLGISGVLTAAFSWKGESEGKGSQIDLIIDRNDNLINLCEMKFASGPFQIDKKYNETLRSKRAAFQSSTNTRKATQITMITTYGLKQNIYSAEIPSEVILDNLFE
jgi:AAA+ ATPase superfamily predicted ATPase